MQRHVAGGGLCRLPRRVAHCVGAAGRSEPGLGRNGTGAGVIDGRGRPPASDRQQRILPRTAGSLLGLCRLGNLIMKSAAL